jgi:kumamolisin
VTPRWRPLTAVAAAALVAVGPVPVVRGASSSLTPRVLDAIDLGRSAAAAPRHVVVGLSLRDRADLEALLVDLGDPASPRFRRFLAPEEFAAAYAPTPAAEAALVAHLEASGLVIRERFANRLLVGAVGTTAAVERAFGVEEHDVLLDGVRHFVAMNEPVLPAGVAEHVIGVLGLDDVSGARSHVRARAAAGPRAALGRSCCHLGPADLQQLYDVPPTADGSGETVVIAGVYSWKDDDVAAFDAAWALPGLPAGSGQVCVGNADAPGCRFSRKHSLEAALDVEYAHALAPGARVVNYMAASRSFADLATVYARILADAPGHVVSTSWGGCEANLAPAVQEVDDQMFAAGAALGEAWFAASGDDGADDCRGERGGHHRLVTVDHPANSPHVVAVGGTKPRCAAGLVPADPACSGYGAESAWPDSGGGASAVFARLPSQTGCGLSGNGARLLPDVAFAADPHPGVYVAVGGRWFIVGGTSAAVAAWGGLFSRVAEKLGAAPGAAGPRLYTLCGTRAFHDVTAGENGAYQAGPGYDPVTGIGSPDVGALVAAY